MTATGQDALTRFERRVSSQNGEDGVITEILRRIGLGPRYFIEFGIEDGAQGNCVALAEQDDWSGLFIECDEAHFARLEARWGGRPTIQTLHARVTADSVNELFHRAGAPVETDVLSIDVDGNDYWIWSALPNYSPRVVVIEYNASLDADGSFAMPRDDGHRWDGTDYFGASIGALRSLAARTGYRIVHTDSAGVNAFFVRQDLASPFPPEHVVPIHPPRYGPQGDGHTRDPLARPFVDVRTGKLAAAARIGPSAASGTPRPAELSPGCSAEIEPS